METNEHLRTPAKYARGAVRHLAAGIFFIFLYCILTYPLKAATFVVTKAADTNDGMCSTDCSLREAIGAANAAGTSDVIEFDSGVFSSPRTITLTGGTLSVSNNGSLFINGTGAGQLTISGNNSTSVIVIQPQAIATINALTIAGGSTAGNGGGIWNNGGNLTLTSSTIRNNGAGLGGGILNNATLTIDNCTIAENRAASVGGRDL